MAILQLILLGNPLRAWAIALGAAGLVLGGLFLGKTVLLHRLAQLAERTETELDDFVVAILKGTRSFTPLLLALFCGAQSLRLPPRVDQGARAFLVLALLLQGALWASAAVAFVLERAISRRSGSDVGGTTTLKALAMACRVVVWSVFLLMALDRFGVNVSGLVTGLGIGGIAVALALQNILGDLFAALSIVLDKPFEVGDFITTGDAAGVVERIGLKTTRLRSLSGEQIVSSNSELLKSRIRNFKRMTERRVVFPLGVMFGTPADKLAAIPAMVREIVTGQEGVRFDRSHLKEIGDSALLFETVYFLSDPDYTRYMDIQQAINLEIVSRFAAGGIAFAHPVRRMLLEGREGLS